MKSMRLIAAIGCTISLAASALAQAPAEPARVGVAAAVRGEVQLAAFAGPRAVGKIAASGDQIFIGDRITTGAQGTLQIMLLDETVFTIGPNAVLVIDEFIYDPRTDSGKVTASVVKGTFRFVTGRVARKTPSDMEVRLPVASIGVRGTSVAGETDGTRATVVLLGPGTENNAGERPGRILVGGSGPLGAANIVEIARPGFGTDIAGPNQPPGPPVRFEPARLAALTAPLAGGGARPPAPAEQRAAAAPPTTGGTAASAASMRQEAGETRAEAGGTLAALNRSTELARVQQSQLTQAAQHQDVLPAVTDGPTTFDQMRLIRMGRAVFEQSGLSLAPVQGAGSGTYNVRLVVDFGARTVVGAVNGSYVLNTTPGTFSHSFTPFNYTTEPGFAKQTNPETFTTSAGHNATWLLGLRNTDGRVAGTLDSQTRIFGATSCAQSAHCLGGSVSVKGKSE